MLKLTIAAMPLGPLEVDFEIQQWDTEGGRILRDPPDADDIPADSADIDEAAACE